MIWQKQKLGLKDSGTITKDLSETVKRQMLLKQMVKDPTVKQAPHIIKEGIAHDESTQISQRSHNIYSAEFVLRWVHC